MWDFVLICSISARQGAFFAAEGVPVTAHSHSTTRTQYDSKAIFGVFLPATEFFIVNLQII